MVGEGGMGHVFEAFDNELKVRVALKSIRPEIAGNPTALEFFRREVRIARTITHPNVCRTFDLDRGFLSRTPDSRREFFFLTMEFLEGETLSARLKRAGPFAPEDALDIARQIAAALDAAHIAGIVHRDIKPANIMLVDSPQSCDPQTRAVITDFGLARQNPLQTPAILSSISHTGAIGTLAYMAPEQLESGRPVSAATDIYAFGLVLYEMVTGLRAFPSANLLSGIAQRLAGPPPSPRAIAPDLPGVWELVIQGCLRISPNERFKSAGQVVEALGGAATILPSTSSLPALPALPARSPLALHRRFQLAVVILLAVVTLSAVGFRLYRSRADSKVSPGALVYLTAVKNETGERSLDNLTELLEASLGQSAQINLLDQSRVGDTLQLMTKSPETLIDPPTAREIALRTGAVRVIFATVSGSSGNYSLNVDIQQPDGTGPSLFREHWTQSFPWKASGSTASSATIPPELLTTVRNTSDWIRHKVGESANDIARLDTPPEDVTTGNWQAFQSFNEGRRLYHQNRPQDAVVALQRATQLDSKFALAYGSLGDVLLSLHRDIEGYQAYDKALAAGIENRLTRREEDRIRGMRAVDTADYDLAVEAFHDLAVNYPQDQAAWEYPTIPLRMLGRDDEAIANLRRAIQLNPESAFAPYALAQELMIEYRLDEVPQWIDLLKKHNHPDQAAEDEAMLAFLNHSYDKAERILELLHSAQSSLHRSYSYQQLASVQAETGHREQAIATLNQGIAEDKSQANTEQHAAKLLDRAYLECKLNQFDACLSDAHAGFALNATPEHALLADTVLGTATASTPASYLPRIRQELAQVECSLLGQKYGKFATFLKLRTLGEIQLANGKAKEAVQTFEEAAAQDAPAGDREYLARALLAAAAIEHDPKTKTVLLGGARAAYAAKALHPAIAMCDTMDHLPGTYADEGKIYLTIGDSLLNQLPPPHRLSSNIASTPQNSKAYRHVP
jgi:tetratricopeptide (TPR) repeat protein